MSLALPITRARRLSLGMLVTLILVATLLALPAEPAQGQDASLRWSVDLDDVLIRDGNDVSLEGEPILINGSGHPLIIGSRFDPDADPFVSQLGRVAALDPSDGSVAWSRNDLVIDDFGDDPIGVLSTGDVVVVDNTSDPEGTTGTSQPVVLAHEDGSLTADYGDVAGFAQQLVVLPGDAIGFRLTEGSGDTDTYEVREPNGDTRWSLDDVTGTTLAYDPLLPDVLIAVQRTFGEDSATSFTLISLEDGTAAASFTVAGEFAGTPTVLPSGLLVATSQTGFSGDADGWVELLAVENGQLVRLDVLSTAAGDLDTSLLGLTPVNPDGTLLAAVDRAYLGGEFAEPGPLDHQLIEVDPAAGELAVGTLLDAVFERSVQTFDQGADRPVSTLDAATPRGVPDASLIIAAVPNLSEEGQTAVYGQDLDGEVIWQIPADTGIGGTHDFSEVCADGTVFGRSTTSEEAVNDSGQMFDRKVDVWYAIDGAAPAVQGGGGCSRPYGDDGGPGPEPTDPPTDPPGNGDGLDCGGVDGDPATTERADYDDPVAYAVAVSQARFGCGGKDREADHVVLSRDDAFADSLVGAALTGDAPLLFTQTDALPDVTRDEIDRLLDDGDTIYILGGVVAVSQAVEDVLATNYTIRRLAGPSRVETSVAVATEALALGAGGQTLAVARAGGPAANPTAGWADSVTGGAWTAATGTPTVVTDTAGIHPAVQAFLDQQSFTETVLFGGVFALSETVEDGVPGPRRIAGDSRAGTAQAIASDLIGVTPDSSDRRLIVINGFREDGWLFGLPAGGLAADVGAAIAMGQTPVPPETLEMACSPASVDLLLVGTETILDAQAAADLDGAPSC